MNQRRFEWLWFRGVFRQEWPSGNVYNIMTLVLSIVGFISSAAFVMLLNGAGLLYVGVFVLTLYLLTAFLKNGMRVGIARILLFIFSGVFVALASRLDLLLINILKP